MRRPLWMWGVLALGSASGCAEHPTAAWEDITTPLIPPPAYQRWWHELEKCTGTTGDFSALRWQVVAGDTIPREGGGVAGIYFRSKHTIQLAEAWVTHSGVVKHEMLHALNREHEHGHWAFSIRNPCGVTPYEYLAWEPELDHDLNRGPDTGP